VKSLVCLNADIVEFRANQSIFISNQSLEVSESQLRDAVFEDCTFIGTNISNRTLEAATFLRCVFVGCEIDDTASIRQLTGCRGYFVIRGAKKSIERAGYPKVWTHLRAKREVARFRDLGRGLASADPKQSVAVRARQVEFLSRAHWEDVLAIAFQGLLNSSAQHGTTFEDIQRRLAEVESDREALVAASGVTRDSR
jgi:hypothetical protein